MGKCGCLSLGKSITVEAVLQTAASQANMSGTDKDYKKQLVHLPQLAQYSFVIHPASGWCFVLQSSFTLKLISSLSLQAEQEIVSRRRTSVKQTSSKASKDSTTYYLAYHCGFAP